MVKVKIINACGQGYTNGEIYEVEPNEAKRLVENGHAIALDATPKKENAAAVGHAKAQKAVKE